MRKASLKAWVDNLRTKNMPVLGKVVAELNKITDSDETSAMQLSEVILRDPNLTSHVLRVANSVTYNYSKQKINTISRAIVLIGMKGMRAICISLLILDRLLHDQPKTRVIALVAQGFHAATQAQNVLGSDNAEDAEEVFIAALLFNLGEMAFWMYQKINEQNNDLLSDDPALRKIAMENVLGGSFKGLTRELAKHWKLGDTVQEALYPGSSPSIKAQAVITGERISRAALYGWDSPQVGKVLKEVASLRSISTEDALAEIKSCADKASIIAVSYGAAEVCPMIPSALEAGDFEKRTPTVNKILKPDAHIQLSVLRELSGAIAENLDVNTILQMVLEGMHRGIGLERVAIAFATGHKVQAKYALGEGTDHWRDRFLFDIGPYTDNIFTHGIDSPGPVWFNQAFIDAHPQLYSPDIVQILGRQPSMIFVLRVGDRNAAFFYVDRASFGGAINQEQFESFKHFSSQAQQCLNMFKDRRRQ